MFVASVSMVLPCSAQITNEGVKRVSPNSVMSQFPEASAKLIAASSENKPSSLVPSSFRKNYALVKSQASLSGSDLGKVFVGFPRRVEDVRFCAEGWSFSTGDVANGWQDFIAVKDGVDIIDCTKMGEFELKKVKTGFGSESDTTEVKLTRVKEGVYTLPVKKGEGYIFYFSIKCQKTGRYLGQISINDGTGVDFNFHVTVVGDRNFDQFSTEASEVNVEVDPLGKTIATLPLVIYHWTIAAREANITVVSDPGHLLKQKVYTPYINAPAGASNGATGSIPIPLDITQYTHSGTYRIVLSENILRAKPQQLEVIVNVNAGWITGTVKRSIYSKKANKNFEIKGSFAASTDGEWIASVDAKVPPADWLGPDPAEDVNATRAIDCWIGLGRDQKSNGNALGGIAFGKTIHTSSYSYGSDQGVDPLISGEMLNAFLASKPLKLFIGYGAKGAKPEVLGFAQPTGYTELKN